MIFCSRPVPRNGQDARRNASADGLHWYPPRHPTKWIDIHIDKACPTAERQPKGEKTLIGLPYLHLSADLAPGARVMHRTSEDLSSLLSVTSSDTHGTRTYKRAYSKVGEQSPGVDDGKYLVRETFVLLPNTAR